MRRRLALLTREMVCVAFCVAVFGATSASAATLDGGVFSSTTCTPCSGSFSSGVATSGAIDDLYAFQVTGTDPLLTVNSVTNSFGTPESQIKNFTLSLFMNSGTLAAPVPSGAALASAIANFTPGATSGNQFAGLSAISLSAGDYVLQVVGQAVGATYGGSFQFFAAPPVLAAPLPASILLLAAGLGVFGFAGRRRYRRRAELATS